MCGRYTLTPEASEIVAEFPDLEMPADWTRRYNVAPTDRVLVVTDRGGHRALEMFAWGLIPSWAKDPKIGGSLINARADSVATKPAFRAAFKKRRCLVLADGFYEWRRVGSKKQPMYFRMKDHGVFGMAGLWEIWKPAGTSGGEYTLSCTIVTGPPNELVAPIHDRMPVIVPRQEHSRWLSGETNAAALSEMLKPYPAEEMVAFEVSARVNSVRNDVPACIAPINQMEPLELF